jgi:lysozyme
MPTHISAAGLALLQSFEGFQEEALRLEEGRWLIGHGHVRSSPPAEPISAEEALALLREDLAPVEAAVARGVFRHLEPGQFDALVSFAFSIGVEAFQNSAALRRLNAGDLAGCAQDIFAWRFQHEEPPYAVEALARRRAVEMALLLDAGPRPQAPSALTQPRRAAQAQPAADLDEIEARLRRILAAEPATARTLAPPPAPPQGEGEDEAEEAGFTWTAAAAPAPPAVNLLQTLAQDRLALASLCGAGLVLLLIATGLRAGAPGAWGDAAAVLLGAPGALLALGALYLLLIPLMRRNTGRR